MSRSNNAQIISSSPAGARTNIVSCAQCSAKRQCFPGVDEDAIECVNSIVQRTQPLRKGEHVHEQGRPFNALYAVRAGAVKAYKISVEGEEQITGLYLAGEIFGMDGLGNNRYATSVTALETSTICTIPFEQLRQLSVTIPALQQRIIQIMSLAIVSDQEFIRLLSKYSAERRVAALLQRLSRHQVQRKLSATKLRLPLSRIDISCYLGLTVETVSRVFGRLQKMGLLMLGNREVEIASLQWLDGIAEGDPSGRNMEPQVCQTFQHCA